MANVQLGKYELVIIGGGPAGLAAALYSAREGVKTLVLERGAIGGMAAITYKIDNYAGFHEGITGLELADRLEAHAKRFGAEIHPGVEVNRLATKPGEITVATTAGPIRAESVLITTGSAYRSLGIAGEKDYIGRGVHYCATCDAPLYRGKEVVVVGGGNSAAQESLFIARFASHVTLLVRGKKLDATKVVEDELKALKNVSFRFDTRVEEIRGDGSRVTGVRVLDLKSDKTVDLRADAVFVFIGLKANTAPFANSIELDEDKFIVTDADFATSKTGIYAAGDVRSGSTWQIASAVGEGVTAALAIRSYLGRLHHRKLSAKTKSAATKKAASKTKA
jgi:thioredoxin reductase (NADPH)